jgi:hypothetical protein
VYAVRNDSIRQYKDEPAQSCAKWSIGS